MLSVIFGRVLQYYEPLYDRLEEILILQEEAQSDWALQSIALTLIITSQSRDKTKVYLTNLLAP